MPEDILEPILRQDYSPPTYKLETVDLNFDLNEEVTHVTSQLVISLSSDVNGEPLHLDGRGFDLVSIKIDGKPLVKNTFKIDSEQLTIFSPPDRFTLVIETAIKPNENTSLQGLYKSGGSYCTQCEAEGFRTITYFPDHPDVMATYTTTITADRERYPVLLSNGNNIDSGMLANGRHWAKWQDPFPKPSYLFALVAGNFVAVEDHFTTASGRIVKLKIFVEPGNEDSCAHAMDSLKRAMRWDEDKFGLEYDLDIFMIVAVRDFNFGAMENKGLNIFNAKYILAKPAIATDSDYAGIEAVIAHEYFHNWTGNRVTCRDWFQLSLKEGLTVFRDQEFSSDMRSRAVKRIEDVRVLRASQFPEDAGPLAHPVRPSSYLEIDNFYTATVYVKGAEIVRMVHTLIGEKAFCKGLSLYLKRHDGQAATIEDFLTAMSDSSEQDLTQFKLWYDQAGTPEIIVNDVYYPATNSYLLTVEQTCTATPGQAVKQPLHMPLVIGLLDDEGNELPLSPIICDKDKPNADLHILQLYKARQTFQFKNINKRPILSLLRGFSAPVIMKLTRKEDRVMLFTCDSDLFNRWEAGQQMATELLLEAVSAYQNNVEPAAAETNLYVNALGQLLTENSLECAFVAEAIRLPSEAYIGDQMKVVDVEAIHWAREGLRQTIAKQLKNLLIDSYHAHSSDRLYSPDAEESGRRSLRNGVLNYLISLDDPEMLDLCINQYRSTDNMTDRMAALGLLTNIDHPARQEALEDFYEQWRDEALVLDKWFAVQAVSILAKTLETIKLLITHTAFSLHNPNSVRALIGTFASANLLRFHEENGKGYRFLADCVLELDRLNPQVAARLLTLFGHWRRYDEDRQILIKGEVKRVLSYKKLSRATYEIATKTLA